MATDLFVVQPILQPADVPAFIRGGHRQPVAPIGRTANFDLFRATMQDLLGALGTLSPRTDAELAPILHDALNGVSRRQLLDPGLWQWLCLEPLRDYVLARWCAGASIDAIDGLTTSQLARFVGGSTLNGAGRNALARLFWGADAAHVDTGRYDDCKLVFASADLFVGVFERKIGLHAQAAMAIIRRLLGEPEAYRREALKRLNFVLSTTALEALEGPSVIHELDQLMR